MSLADVPALQVAQTRGGRLGYVVSGTGEPVIVLINGAGMSIEGWEALYPDVECFGTVFAYNRFGVKGSDPPLHPQTGTAVVGTLRELLGYAGLAPPYLLVGHSLGALFASLFARLHPRETLALLLIAPTFPDDVSRMRAGDEQRFAQGTSRALGLPQPMLRANLHSELGCVDETLREVNAAGPLPHVPREVLQGHGHFPQLSEPQSVLAALARLVKLAQHRRAAAD